MDNLPPNYIYAKDELPNVVRTKFCEESEIDDWVAAFMELTKTAWSIDRTIRTDPTKAKKHVFKRIYHCHFKTQGRTLKNPRKREHSSKNIDCPAELEIIIKYIPKQKSRARTYDPLLKQWPCIISLKNQHNHTIISAAALTKRPIGSETKNEIVEYFNKGHSPSSAYHSFCFKNMEELGDKYESMVIDRHYFPTKNDFSNLWKQHFKANYGETTGEQMFSKLIENLNNSPVQVMYKLERDIGNGHYVLALSSPVMQRAANLLIQTSEILFVDATSNCDVQSHKLYFFATHSPAGGIPVGCIISTSQKQEVFSVGVRNLRELIPKVNPTVIITDDDLVERKVLSEYWPNSTILLCTFHVLKSVWKWLTLSRNNIQKEDRQTQYALFRKILMSNSQEELDENLRVFQVSNKYPQYKKYIQEKLEKIEMWCLFYRKQFITRGTNTNNYIEVMFRLFKDIPLERTKAYNLPQLADFVINDFENYYRQRILDLVFNKVSRATLRRLCPDEKNVTHEQINDLGDMQYSVSSCSTKGVTYFVDMKINICSCHQGVSGKICKHQSAIIINFNINAACNTLTLGSRANLYEIATGSKPTTDLFLPLELKHLAPDQDMHVPNKISSNEINNNSSSNHLLESDDLCSRVPDVTAEDRQIAKEKWENFLSMLSETVTNAIEDDPEGFIPAVEVCMNSFHKNINSSSTLMTGLYNAFKPNSLTTSKATKKIYRKGKKISVQPTSIARRKVSACGRRKAQAGRKVSSLVAKKSRAPHDLQVCIDRNVALGDNKFSK